jgi:penicillin-binding protein 1C
MRRSTPYVAQPFRAATRAWAGLKACATSARVAAALGITLLLGAAWIRLGPIPADLLDDRASASALVLDRNGVKLYEALSGDGARTVKLQPSDLPATLAAATLAAEDRRFRSHPGVDPVALMRAAKRNLSERQIVEGGSTISQQVAKLLLIRRDGARGRGLRAKASEAILALRLEHRFSKREILAMYLNLASYGNQMVGAERASRAYFGRSASMLTPAQAAFLAGLPQRPSGFNPYRKPAHAAAIRRQQSVIRRMEESGALTKEQADEARAEQLVLMRETPAFKAPHFVEMVLAASAAARPAQIETTLDAALQDEVTGIIGSHRAALTRHGAANVAVVVLHNATGQWLAWEGSGDYADAASGGAINGPLAGRQPGSALKPFTYALAFEQGFTPASVLPDVPTNFPTAEAGVMYSPRNYDGRYRGPLLARRALAGSENVPAVALASEVGVPALLRFLQRAGFTTFDRSAAYYGLGVTLGNAEVRLAEMVAAYSAFARGGEWLEPSPLMAPAAPQQRRMLVSPRTAFWITDILSDDEAREYIFGRGGSLEFPFSVAVKTGTSQAYHDNWTIGYTPEVTVGVWVGNFDREPLRQSSGVTGAAPIFHGVMLAAHARYGRESFDTRPIDGVEEREICELSGEIANQWCPARRRERLPSADAPVPCSWHHLSDEGLIVVWPPQYRQWAQRNARVATGAATKVAAYDGAVGRRRPELQFGHRFEIVNPAAGAIYLIDPTLRPEFQALPLRVVSAAPGRIDWEIDGKSVGSSRADRPFMWPLAHGKHTITARHEDGSVAASSVRVR